MNISVTPKISQNTISSIQILTSSINLFNSAEFNVVLRDSNGFVISTRTLTMSPSDYLSWNNDDQYALDWVLTQLDLDPN